MGILNVTPDSFSDGGRYAAPEAAIAHGLRLLAEGADVLDIGGESTRPGAEAVSAEEESRRVLPVIEALAQQTRLPLSIDTSKAAVAAAALQAGASIVNDVTALGDPAMAEVVSRAKAEVILMHMQGQPRTMQRAPRYRDVVREVAASLSQAARRAKQAGIARARIWLDPGIGFGKTPTHNLQLMAHLSELTRLGYPLLLGASRKSFLGRILGAETADRLPGSLACVAEAWSQGVRMVRVHDVAATVQFIRLLEALDTAR